MGKIRLRSPRPRPARPLDRPAPPRAPPAPINTGSLRASPHSSLAIRARRTSAPVFSFNPVFVFSDSHNESHNISVRDRRLRTRYCQRPRAAASRRRERRDPDVPIQVTGSGTFYAEEQEDLEVRGDPACDRLHLRLAVSAGEPSRYGSVRRGGCAGEPSMRDTRAPAPAPARAPCCAKHHPS